MQREYSPVGQRQDIDDFKNMWGEMHPSIEKKLNNLSKEDLIKISMTAMSGMSNVDRIGISINKIKELLK